MTGTRTASQEFMLKYPRPMGAALLLIGAGLFYGSIVKPIQQAQAGAAEISISMQGAAISIILVVIGLTYTLFGAKFAKLFQPSSEESMLPSIVVGIVLAAIGMGLFFALKAYVESQGYVFQN